MYVAISKKFKTSDRNRIPTLDSDSGQIMIRGMMNKVMTSVETTTKTISQKSSIFVRLD